MSNKHPPIPPNCEWFFECDENGRWCAHLAVPGSAYYFWLIEDYDRIGANRRKIIAAVARAAWLDEARKQSFGPDVSTEKVLSNREAARMNYELTCEDNAEAWRVWGE